jgi:hypothetical protein
MEEEMETWSVRARNLPEHAANPIHTDAGGRAAGFDGALVAGVTVYAYLTRPVVEAWGVDWLSRGLAEVEFTSPVLDDDPVDCVPEAVDGGVEVRAMVGGDSRARLVAMPVADDDGPSTRPLHQPLEPQVEALVGEWEGYGLRAGEVAESEREVIVKAARRLGFNKKEAVELVEALDVEAAGEAV